MLRKYFSVILVLMIIAVVAVIFGPEIRETIARLNDAPLGSLGMVGGVGVLGVMRYLPGSYIHKKVTYSGPGMVDVPDTFPELDENGKVIFPKGSKAASNQESSRRVNGSPPPVSKDKSRALSHTVSGKTEKELADMTKPELVELATTLGLQVERSDGDTTKEPLVEDYRAALGAKV